VNAGLHSFAVGASAGLKPRWHAVNVAALRARKEAAREDRDGHRVQEYSVCGLPCMSAARLGPFTPDNPLFEEGGRCERCGWVVAVSCGTLDQEIDGYTPVGVARQIIAEAGLDPDLLPTILIAILADAPPGLDGESGHRSDLLAHAAAHRPVILMCEQCSRTGCCTEVHGPLTTTCPHASVICGACTFTAGTWAGWWEGAATGDCDVAAPCSVLTELAYVYGIITRPTGVADPWREAVSHVQL